jgi:hypothetical protein
MDVTLNTNYFPASRANQNSAKTSLDTAAITNNIEHAFKYNEVMMNLEELQNFLFMLIGAEVPENNSGSDKGNKVNLFA